MNSNQAMLEYLMNKFCPYIVLVFLLFYNFELSDVSFYAILGTALFIDWYSGRVGRAMQEYDQNQEFRKIVDESIEDDS